MVLEFLRRHPSEVARDDASRTLRAMARGGLYDQLGGGFARYTVDADWVVPHFEKMLYDNAPAARVYARGVRPQGERVAREIADFMLGELRTPEGGFASALDADSEGEEGTFYVWTPQQLVDVLGQETAGGQPTCCQVTESGTFEHGASTLQLLRGPGRPERWAAVDSRRPARRARDQRERPARDDKVVAAWNGLAISGLCEAGTAARADPLYVAAAARRRRAAGRRAPGRRPAPPGLA